MTTTIDITTHLIQNHRFSKYYGDKHELDINGYTCMLRLHEVHYLFYSERLKHFSIAVRREDQEGRFKSWKSILIPKAIHSPEEADAFLKAFL